MADHLDLIISFVSGLFIGAVTTYLGHLWSMRRTKEEEFLPYLRKLYGIVSRIMDRTDAENFKTQYNRLIDAKVNEKMRELAIKELTEGQTSKIPMPIWWSPSLATYITFVMSFKHLIEVAKECRDFESVYAEMEIKGLIQALKLRNNRLSGYLNMFHSSAEYVSDETSDIIEKLEKIEQTSEAIAVKEFKSIFQDDMLQRLLELTTHNLFHFGLELKKQLEKHV